MAEFNSKAAARKLEYIRKEAIWLRDELTENVIGWRLQVPKDEDEYKEMLRDTEQSLEKVYQRLKKLFKEEF